MNFLLSHAKSIIGALVTFLGGIQVGLGNGLTGQEFLGALIAGLVAFGAVFGTPNKGMESAQKVVDQVKRLVPEDVAAAIDEVIPAARGVLKTVT